MRRLSQLIVLLSPERRPPLGCRSSNRDPLAEFSERIVAALLGGDDSDRADGTSPHASVQRHAQRLQRHLEFDALDRRSGGERRPHRLGEPEDSHSEVAIENGSGSARTSDHRPVKLLM
jgi:hypothetical protein